MPRDLFGAVTNPPAHIGMRSRFTLPLSLAAHAVALTALVVVPLVATDVLPLPNELLTITLTPAPLPAEPPPVPPPRGQTPPPRNPEAAPLDAPTGVSAERPTPPPTDLSDVPEGSVFSSVFGSGDDRVAGLTPPPPPVVQRPAVRVGGTIKAPLKTHDVAPVYPPIAIASRIEGVVIIQATIGVDGRVVDAVLLRPAPFLDQAALDAVRQWRYSPTELNGEPVAVVMTVTVSFKLR